MKKFFIFLFMFVALVANAQSDKGDKVNFSPDENVNYRLFKTQNIHIFIKLNTANGTMKLVQYSTSDFTSIMQVSLSDTVLATGTDAKKGRFYLYPTDNFFTFLLLDQIDGRGWQVPWSVDERSRGIIPIKEYLG